MSTMTIFGCAVATNYSFAALPVTTAGSTLWPVDSRLRDDVRRLLRDVLVDFDRAYIEYQTRKASIALARLVPVTFWPAEASKRFRVTSFVREAERRRRPTLRGYSHAKAWRLRA